MFLFNLIMIIFLIKIIYGKFRINNRTQIAPNSFYGSIEL